MRSAGGKPAPGHLGARLRDLDLDLATGATTAPAGGKPRTEIEDQVLIQCIGRALLAMPFAADAAGATLRIPFLLIN